MKIAISIPADLEFDGTIPTEAANVVISELVTAESELSEWQKARLGKITASCFGDVKCLKNGAWGETAMTYLYDLIGEHLTGKPSETFTGTKATDWGNEYEAQAIEAYTKRTGRKTQPAKFLQHNQLALVGGTPDRLCGEQGVIEVKCPFNYKNHLRTVITKKVPSDYKDQVLGHLLLSGREWCDFISYDPRIKSNHRLAIVRVRAKEYKTEIQELSERLAEFHNMLLEKLKALKIKSIHQTKV